MNPDRDTIYYSAQKSGHKPGLRYANPRYFDSVRSGVTKVFIIGNWPEVAQAYRMVGADVVVLADGGSIPPAPRIAPRAPAAAPAAPQAPAVPDTAYLPTAEPRAEQAAVVIPEGWQDLTWKELRAIAAQVCDTPIINKGAAVIAIEAELARRGA